MDTFALVVTETLTEGTTTQTSKRTQNLSDATISQSVDDKVTIAAGVTNQLLNFDNMASVKYLMLTFSGPLTVMIGATTSTPLSFSTGGVLVIAAALVSAIYVTNAGATPVTVTRVACTP